MTNLRLMRFSGLDFRVLANVNTFVTRVVGNGESIAKSSIGMRLEHFCTATPQMRLLWGGSTSDVLLKKLESALLGCKDDEVWNIFRKFKSVYGLPPPSVVSKLICDLSYSSDSRSLPKACNLVFKIAKENPTSLQKDGISRLCLSLARAQMPVPASKLLRLTLVNKIPLTTDVLGSVFMHMVKTHAGTHLASNVLLEFCEQFRLLTAKRSELALSVKPSTTICNIVLEACVKLGSSLKAEQIIEAMAWIGVVADLHSVLLFSHVYELNGQRDELKKFKEYIDQVSVPLARHYCYFYDTLLKLHFKFDDIDAAAKLVEERYFYGGYHPSTQNKDLINPCRVPVGSPYLLEGLKNKVVFELLQKDSIFHVKGDTDLLELKDGKIILTSKGLAQLIAKFKKSERISDLSKLLAAIEKKTSNDTRDDSICRDVIHACVYSGFLETAHDILDDMEAANISIPETTYMLLLNAYCKDNMTKEAVALAKQINRVGLDVELSDEMIVSKCRQGVIMSAPTSNRQSEITVHLTRVLKKDDNAVSRVYVLNSLIYFFCKAKMMEDARKIYRKMQENNIQPTMQTFAYLIHACSSVENYREVTILWGDIKRYTARGCSLVHRDLYELVLINFLRGGYFERVMEILGLMKVHGMYADRWLYNYEFVSRHKNLYRKLKANDATTEAQRSRIEHVTAFRMWVRNN